MAVDFLGIDWNPIDWWNSWFGHVTNWLGGLGGDIASGIEGGVVGILKDIWNVILPFAEIIVGVLLAFFVINVFILSSKGGQAIVTAAAMGIK